MFPEHCLAEEKPVAREWDPALPGSEEDLRDLEDLLLEDPTLGVVPVFRSSAGDPRIPR